MRSIDFCVLAAAPIVAVCSLVGNGSADSKAHKEIELEPPGLVAPGPQEPLVRTVRAHRVRPLPGVRRARPSATWAPGVTDPRR